MTIRLYCIVEGETEAAFVAKVLAPHLGGFDISCAARLVLNTTSRRKAARGGIRAYAPVRQDIVAWLKQDQNADARFTTMFDLYALPDDFPRFGDAHRASDPYARIAILEDGLAADIADGRFVPYLQLHEFEALLLSDMGAMGEEFLDKRQAVALLAGDCAGFESPELVDDGVDSAPSKRILGRLPGYSKKAHGPVIAGKIGIGALKAKCRHFREWVETLERLGRVSSLTQGLPGLDGERN